MKFGDSEVQDFKFGDTQVQQLFLGDTEVWSAGGGVIIDDYIAFFKLNGDIIDDTGNYTASPNATNTFISFGNKQGLKMENYVNGTFDSTITFPPNSTICYWIESSDIALQNSVPMAFDDSNFFMAQRADLWVSYEAQGSEHIITEVNTPTFVVFTDNGTNIDFYKNKIKKVDIDSSYTTFSNKSLSFIGGYSASSYTITGVIADIRIYDRVLTQDEIDAVYDFEKGDYE